jgi:cephalosporin hydroxylase
MPSAAEDPIVAEFHRRYYERRTETWGETYWLGHRVLKCPLDLWIYQEILHELRPELIVETGTYRGGSALFLASICDLLGRGEVVTIDSKRQRGRPRNRRITYLHGSSTAPEITRQVERRAKGKRPILVILDSGHGKAHVLDELRTYAPLVTPGSYLIVEDTNLNGHPVEPGHGPGPAEAVAAFLAENAAFHRDPSREKLLLTFNPDGYLQKVDGARPTLRSLATSRALGSGGRRRGPADALGRGGDRAGHAARAATAATTAGSGRWLDLGRNVARGTLRYSDHRDGDHQSGRFRGAGAMETRRADGRRQGHRHRHAIVA